MLAIIVILQCVYLFVDFTTEDISPDTDELLRYEGEIDSVRRVEVESQKPKIYPFNPNYITDYKGETLGMSTEEIDRLLAYRKAGKWINSSRQFQEVTKVSDSLLAKISPYFKFPDWVTKPKTKKSFKGSFRNTPKTYAQKKDLNTASSKELQMVNGVGPVLADRIIAFRNTFSGGFIADVQLNEVYGLSPEVITHITEHFTIKTPRTIETLNINSASIDQLVTIQYIDYEIAHNIIEYRQLHEGFKSLEELSKVKDFPIRKLEIIKLSLHIH